MSTPRTRRRDDASLDPAERHGLFTVHVRARPDGSFGGRATHAATGEVAHFDSVDELVEYLVTRTSRAS